MSDSDFCDGRRREIDMCETVEARQLPPRTTSFRESVRRSVLRKKESIERFYRGYSFARSESNTSRFEPHDPGCGMVNFFTLKILFVDIFIAGGDVISDYAQGVALIRSEGENFPDSRLFGLITIGINWLPGVAAALHLISMYRHKYQCKWILIWAALLIIFYPLVPLAAYINLLWKRPKDPNRSRYKTAFREAEYLAMIAHSIAGGIESPLQFILQVWLIVNGKIPEPWSVTGHLVLRDWYGNEVHLPTTAAISLIFSILSMVKAVIEFNIIRVHIQDINSGHKILESLEIIFCHLPYLSLAGFFRISSISLLLTYLNAFAFVPIGLFWLSCVAIGYRSFNLEKIPLWLVSFIAVLFPICFTTHVVTEKNRPKMILLQYKTFWQQTLCSVLCLCPALIFCMYQINCDRSWAYDSNVILSNSQFNAAVATVLLAGIASCAMARRPNWQLPARSYEKIRSKSNILWKAKHRLKRSGTKDTVIGGETIKEEDDDKDIPDGPKRVTYQLSQESDNEFLQKRISRRVMTRFFLKSLSGFFIICLIFGPIIGLQVAFYEMRVPPAYVAFKPKDNFTKVIKALPLVQVPDDITGCLRFPYVSTEEDEDGKFVLPSCSEAKILLMERSNWLDCYNSQCFSGSDVVIIIDGHDVSSNQQFRPSYPTIDIRLPENLVVLLVQSVDADWFFPARAQCLNSPCRIIISKSHKSIPESEFECDAGLTRRLPYDDETLIDPRTRRIRGRQYRTLLCRWGGRSCFGFPSHQEHRDFCDGKDIVNYFKNNGFNWEWDHGMDISGRIFHAMGSTDDECLSKSSVRECDSMSESGNRWSRWLRCDERVETSLIRKRYCEVSSKCLLQEKELKVPRDQCDQDL